MSTVGAVATLLNTVASWVLSPDGLAAFQAKRALAAKKKEVLDALQKRDFDTLRKRIDELRVISSKP